MSSSFGGSAGFGGSGNRVVYIVTVDSSGVSQGLQTAEQAFNRFNTAAQSTARNLQTVGAPLGQLDSGLMSTSTNLDATSQSFNNLDSSLQTTKPDLDAINSNWQQMDSGASGASNSVDALGNSFNAAKGGLSEYNTLSGTVVTNTQNMGDATQTMGDKVKGAGSFLKQHGLALALVTSSVVNLASSYTQLQKSQLAADRANVMSEKAQQRVVKAQDALNKAVKQFGPDSHEAAVKAQDLKLAQESATIAMEKAALAMQTANQQRASFIPQLIQDMVLIGAGTANMITGFKDGVPVIRGFASALKTGLAPTLLAISAPILVAVAGIYALMGALRAAQKLNELARAKMGGKGQEMSVIESIRRSMFGTPEEKKQAADWNKQMENNVVTQEEYTKIMKEAFNPISMIDDIVGQVNTSLGKLNTTQATGTETTNALTTSNQTLGQSYLDLSGVMEQHDINVANDAKLWENMTTLQGENQVTIDALGNKYIQINGKMVPYTHQLEKMKPALSEADKMTQLLWNELSFGSDIVVPLTDDTKKLNTAVQDTGDVMGQGVNKVDAYLASLKTWGDFATQFNKPNQDLVKVLGIDIDPEKILKNLIGKLDKGLRKELKLNLQFQVQDEAIDKAYQTIARGLLKASSKVGSEGLQLKFEFDPKEAENTAKKWKKDLDKQLEKEMKKTGTQDPFQKALSDKIGTALEGGVTESEWLDILKTAAAGADIPPIPVYLVADPKIDTSGLSPVELEAIIDANSISYGNVGQSGASTAGSFNQAEAGVRGKMLTSKPVGVVPVTAEITDVAFTMGEGPTMLSGKIGDAIRDIIKRYLGLQLQGDPKFPQLGFMWDDRSTLQSSKNDPYNQGNVPKGDSPQVPQINEMDKLARQILQITKNLSALGQAARTNFNSVSNYAKGATVFLQQLQKGLANLAIQGANSTKLLGNAAKTNFNSVANYAKGAEVFAQQLQKGLANLSNQGIKSMTALGKSSKTQFNSVANYAKGAEVGAQKLQKGLANLDNEGTKSMKELAKASSSSMNGMINNFNKAASAAKSLASAIRAIPKPPSGVTSFASGGIISAASGIMTTGGPQMIMVGDNPGGHETIAAIPNNAPVDMMNLLNSRFGTGSRGGSSGSIVNQQINLHVSGSDLINERNLTKRIKMTVGADRDKYG